MAGVEALGYKVQSTSRGTQSSSSVVKVPGIYLGARRGLGFKYNDGHYSRVNLSKAVLANLFFKFVAGSFNNSQTFIEYRCNRYDNQSIR
jgi:hypothetical protein